MIIIVGSLAIYSQIVPTSFENDSLNKSMRQFKNLSHSKTVCQKLAKCYILIHLKSKVFSYDKVRCKIKWTFATLDFIDEPHNAFIALDGYDFSVAWSIKPRVTVVEFANGNYSGFISYIVKLSLVHLTMIPSISPCANFAKSLITISDPTLFILN